MASFADTIRGFETKTVAALDGVFQDVVIDLGIGVIRLTPVLTGRLKGNWQLTANNPSNKSLIRYDGEGSATMSDLITQAMTLTAGQVAYIVNNLNYADQIEWGGSPTKAPEGMLRVTVSRFLQMVEESVNNRRV